MILITVRPVFPLTPKRCVLSEKAADTNNNVFGLTWPEIQLTTIHYTIKVVPCIYQVNPMIWVTHAYICSSIYFSKVMFPLNVFQFLNHFDGSEYYFKAT